MNIPSEFDLDRNTSVDIHLEVNVQDHVVVPLTSTRNNYNKRLSEVRIESPTSTSMASYYYSQNTTNDQHSESKENNSKVSEMENHENTSPNPDDQAQGKGQKTHEDEDITTTTTTKKLINLLRGWPSPHLLPSSLLKKAANQVLSDPSIFVPALQYGPDPGYQPLREELAVWLGKAYHYHYHSHHGPAQQPDRGGTTRKTAANPSEICITGGASQSIANILSSFTDPEYTRSVWCVAPCYFLACPIFEDAGFKGRLRAVPEDEEGVDLEFLERGLRKEQDNIGDGEEKPKYKDPSPDRKIYRHIIYAVPTCANPSGKSMSLRRRQALVNLARQYDALIICDDVYDFLQWPTLSSPDPDNRRKPIPTPYPLLPRLSDIDIPLGPTEHDPKGKHFGHAISNGTFSKLVGPGVRTGWVHGTADFAHGLSATGASRSGGAPSQLTAAILHQILSSGEIDHYLEHNVRPGLQSRHAVAAAAVKRELGWAGIGQLESSEKGKETFGGYFLWLTLPEGFDGKELAERALREENLIIAPGSNFEVAGDEDAFRFPRNLRLTFSWEDEADLVVGIERLGAVLRRMAAGEEVNIVGSQQVEGAAAAFK